MYLNCNVTFIANFVVFDPIQYLFLCKVILVHFFKISGKILMEQYLLVS